MSGSWPPSKYGGTPPPARAFWPLVPFPPVLTLPLPWPRPIRMRSRLDPLAGVSSWICIALFLHDAHQVAHLGQHAAGHRRIRVLDDLVHLAQAESLHRRPLARIAADRAAHQLQPEGVGRFSHGSAPAHRSYLRPTAAVARSTALVRAVLRPPGQVRPRSLVRRRPAAPLALWSLAWAVRGSVAGCTAHRLHWLEAPGRPGPVQPRRRAIRQWWLAVLRPRRRSRLPPGGWAPALAQVPRAGAVGRLPAGRAGSSTPEAPPEPR